MKNILILTTLMLMAGGTFAQEPWPQPQPAPPIVGPVTNDAYGPGVHMDATGRMVKVVPLNGGQSVFPIRVTKHRYAPWVYMDEFGRAVTIKPFDPHK